MRFTTFEHDRVHATVYKMYERVHKCDQHISKVNTDSCLELRRNRSTLNPQYDNMASCGLQYFFAVQVSVASVNVMWWAVPEGTDLHPVQPILGTCRTKTTWPKSFSQEDLRKRLTPMQYHVTQEKGTERWDNPHGITELCRCYYFLRLLFWTLISVAKYNFGLLLLLLLLCMILYYNSNILGGKVLKK